MGRILVIDADAHRRVEFARALNAESHDVEFVGSSARARLAACASRPDLVILHGAFPDATCAEVCGALRRDSSTAQALLLVLGPLANEAFCIEAFEAGADDYVPTPYSTREVLLRIRALLRRIPARAWASNIVMGSVRIDRGTRRVTMAGKPVTLTRREFDLLMRLFDSRGRVLARETIVADVWPDDAPSPRVVDTTLKRLRKKLPGMGRRIRTVRGVGYELTPDAP